MTTATLEDLSRLAGEYTLDPTHTRIGFVVRHAMVTKVRGTFNGFEGAAHIDDDPSRSWARLTIDADTIDTRNGIRDNHVRGSFLDVRNHPRITFESTTVRRLDALTVEVSGDLTIRGVARRVVVPFEFQGAATDPHGTRRAVFEGAVVVNRRDWGVTWNAALEAGGALIGDLVTLEFEVSVARTP